MPDAGRTREPCVQKSVHSAHARNQRAAGTTGTPCAMGYGLYVISSVRRASGHRRRAFVTRGLIRASGDRDRTISPSAPARSSAAPSRPSHPRLNVRDDRDTPLLRGGGMAQRNAGDLPDGASGFFVATGVMQRTSLNRFGKSAFRRRDGGVSP